MTYDFQFFLKRRNIIIIWILAGLITGIKQYYLGEINSHINNFIIFKTSFYHLIAHCNLYMKYPGEYFDIYLYGPVFAIFIAPFSFLPTVKQY